MFSHEVRTYLVVKAERESFVTGEEQSLRRDCYADGWTPINGTSRDFHRVDRFCRCLKSYDCEACLRCVKASVRNVNSFTSERNALLSTLALTFNSPNDSTNYIANFSFPEMTLSSLRYLLSYYKFSFLFNLELRNNIIIRCVLN